MSFLDNPDLVRRHLDDLFADSVTPDGTDHGDDGLFQLTLPAGGTGIAPHRHDGFSESFLVLDGELEIRADDQHAVVHPGDSVYVPRGAVHTFRTLDADVELLMLFTPLVPRAAYYDEMARLFERTAEPTVEELDAIAARHGQVNVHDPSWALPIRPSRTP